MKTHNLKQRIVTRTTPQATPTFVRTGSVVLTVKDHGSNLINSSSKTSTQRTWVYPTSNEAGGFILREQNWARSIFQSAKRKLKDSGHFQYVSQNLSLPVRNRRISGSCSRVCRTDTAHHHGSALKWHAASRNAVDDLKRSLCTNQ